MREGIASTGFTPAETSQRPTCLPDSTLSVPHITTSFIPDFLTCSNFQVSVQTFQAYSLSVLAQISRNNPYQFYTPQLCDAAWSSNTPFQS